MRTLVIVLCFALTVSVARAQQVFTGTDVAFTKPAFADPLDPANQDALSPSVVITRGTTRGIYNIAQEAGFQGQGAASPSPVGTRWAFGAAADFATLPFGTWGDAHAGNPPALVGQDMVLHLVAEDIYLDVRFTEWGQIGGQFAYVRSALPCSPADLASPLGVLDLADISGFANAFLNAQPAADLAPPAGVFDLADLGAFIAAFLGGCP